MSRQLLKRRVEARWTPRQSSHKLAFRSFAEVFDYLRADMLPEPFSARPAHFSTKDLNLKA